MARSRFRMFAVLLVGLIGGIAAVVAVFVRQAPSDALVRKPGERSYQPPVPVAEIARDRWELALLSHQVYERGHNPLATPESWEPPLAGWARRAVGSNAFLEAAADVGLNLEVWQREGPAPVVAVVFEGTRFTSWRDWFTNLRWFVPRHEDQYTVLSTQFGLEFSQWAAAAAEPGTRLYATGHSLGGGLAQHFAYALPPTTTRDGAPLRVSRVVAFDPSPVTGWYSVDDTTRRRNARGLETDRVFEHGEILAYPRLLLGYLMPPSAANPAISEIRVNFDQSWRPIGGHMMRILALGLARAVGLARQP